MAKAILDILLKLRNSEQPHAVATVVETVGSVSAKIGAKAVIDQNGVIVSGWIGGGCAESMTCHEALKNMASGNSSVIAIDLDSEKLGTGMPCGGNMRVFVEPVLPTPGLWIIGHGRVAECLCQMGDLMGLSVVVIDPDVNREFFPNASQLITNDNDYKLLQPNQNDYVVIATQHKNDHESIKIALHSNAAYIALIASKKRARLVLGYLQNQGFNDSDLTRVMAPAGLDLGAQTPEEIALCIISEIVLVRREGTGVRMFNKIESNHQLSQLAK